MSGKQEKGAGARIRRIRTIQSSIPFPVIAIVLGLAVVIEIVFCALTISLGVLPGQYLALLIVVLVAIDVGIFALVTNAKKSQKKFYTGMILTVILMIMLLPV